MYLFVFVSYIYIYIYLWVCDTEVIVFFRSFKKAFNDVILSRRAIRNMNTLYPDATPEELAAADNVCIICREEMVTGKHSTCIAASNYYTTQGYQNSCGQHTRCDQQKTGLSAQRLNQWTERTAASGAE